MTDQWYPMVQLRITGPTGEQVIRLASWKADIDFALAALSRLDLSDLKETVSIYATWSAALVAYGRVFKTDRRERLDDSFLAGSGHEETHRRFLELRDRHIAHHVSEAEQARTVAFLTAIEVEPKSVEGVGPFFIKMVAPMKEQVDADIALVQFVSEYLATQLEAATKGCLEMLRALPVAELYVRAKRGEALRLGA